MKKSCDPFDLLFEEIYNNNYTYLVKYLRMLVFDFNIAEDLAHDIFLRIYKSRNIEITGDKLRNYLRKAAKNIVIDYLRKKAREEAKNNRIIPELMELNESFYHSLENSIIEGEVLSTVNDVLEGFSEKNRKIFLSRILQQKTRNEISKEEKISPHSVKMIENEILYVLRQKLKYFL